MNTKPKVRSRLETENYFDWGGALKRRATTSRIWTVSCACHRDGVYAFAVFGSWEAAQRLATTHAKEFHS